MSAGKSAPVTYTLKHPLTLKDKDGDETGQITELSLRRLNGEDMEHLDKAKGQGSMLIILIARSSGQPASVIRKLDGEDITDAGAIVSGFLGGATSTSSDE